MQNKESKNHSLFIRLFNRLLKIPALKMFELEIGWVKGFRVKIERFSKGER